MWYVFLLLGAGTKSPPENASENSSESASESEGATETEPPTESSEPEGRVLSKIPQMELLTHFYGSQVNETTVEQLGLTERSFKNFMTSVNTKKGTKRKKPASGFYLETNNSVPELSGDEGDDEGICGINSKLEQLVRQLSKTPRRYR
jgi:hypothetical protein